MRTSTHTSYKHQVYHRHNFPFRLKKSELVRYKDEHKTISICKDVRIINYVLYYPVIYEI